MDQHTFTLPDGRSLEVLTAGTPAASAVMFHHGTPGSCITWEEWLPVVAGEFRHALAKSYYGWMDDDLAFVEPWGFDIEKISKPVELWQGDEDFMVPHAHGKWLAAKIPTARLIFAPGEGHISLGINKRSEIVKNALGYLTN